MKKFASSLRHYLGLDNPKSKQIYEKWNDLIEKLSKYIYLAMMYIVWPCVILPKAIGSYFIYLTMDSGSDAFELPFEIWLVFKRPLRLLCLRF